MSSKFMCFFCVGRSPFGFSAADSRPPCCTSLLLHCRPTDRLLAVPAVSCVAHRPSARPFGCAFWLQAGGTIPEARGQNPESTGACLGCGQTWLLAGDGCADNCGGTRDLREYEVSLFLWGPGRSKARPPAHLPLLLIINLCRSVCHFSFHSAVCSWTAFPSISSFPYSLPLSAFPSPTLLTQLYLIIYSASFFARPFKSLG